MYTRDFSGAGEWGIGAWLPAHEWTLLLFTLVTPIIIILVLWSIVWKGLALWHSARRGQYWWFIIFLLLNTLGILEIIYLFFVAKLRWSELFSTKEHHRQS